MPVERPRAISKELSRNDTGILWSGSNPHPGIADAAPEIVFVSASPDNAEPFNADSVISSGLQEVVAVYPGAIRADRTVEGGELTRIPLLHTGTRSGSTDFSTLVRNDFFGMQLNPNPRRHQSPESYVLAMHVTGTITAPPAAATQPTAPSAPRPINVIVVNDADIISETFFDLRRQGFEGLNFDNVTFALNCIDILVGDESFVALRKHRPRHRTLARVEALSQEYADRRRSETDSAEANAADLLAQAQARLDGKVAELRARPDLDEQTKTIMLRNLQSVENRRFEVVKSNIEQDKDRRIAEARAEMKQAVAGIQRTIKWWATIPPPIPTLLLAVGLFSYRQRREKIGMSERQLVGGTS